MADRIPLIFEDGKVKGEDAIVKSTSLTDENFKIKPDEAYSSIIKNETEMIVCEYVKSEIKTETFEEIPITGQEYCESIFNTNNDVFAMVDNSSSKYIPSMENKPTDRWNRISLLAQYKTSLLTEEQMKSAKEPNIDGISTLDSLDSESHEAAYHKKQNPTNELGSHGTDVEKKMKICMKSVFNRKKLLSCEHCSYKSSNCRRLKRHILVHTKERLFSCTNCSYKASQSGNLKRHIISIHTMQKPFSCEQCSYKASESGSMKRHIISVHTKVKNFSCEHCSYKSSRSEYVKNHIISVHTKQKPFSCEHCSYKASVSGTMKRHIISFHTKQKPFSCEHCSYKTSERGNMKRHVISFHTKKRPFACEHCSYNSSRSEHLKKHIFSAHTKGKPFSCEHCLYI